METVRDKPDVAMLDLNILPARHRRRRIALGSILRWVILLTLLGLLVPAYQRNAAVQADLMQQQRDLAAAQAALESYSPLIDQISLLESNLAQARGRIEQIQASYANVQLDGIAWSELLARIMHSVPADSRVVNIAQAENMVVVSGLSEDYQSPLEMAQDLQQSGFFTLVSVDAISSITIEELVEPTPSEESEDDEVVDEELEPEYRFAFSLSLTVPGVSEELE